MKTSDRAVLAGLGLAVLVIVFWVAILSPKRSQESDLSDQITQLRSTVSQMEQTSAAAELERKNFPASYHKLVVLGKAVPADSEQSSLLVQLNSLSDRAGIGFQSLDLSSDTAGATAAATQVQTPALLQSGTASSTSATTDSTGTATPTDSTAGTTSTTATTSTTPTSTTSTTSTTASTTDASTGAVPAPTSTSAVPATEATAATTPLGATVGPAGLPVMPYDLKLSGGFFGIADFLESLDGLVHTRHGGVSVNGRLLTVDGFSLTTGGATSDPTASTTPSPASTGLEADVAVTTYLTPADQGVTGGATPTGPAVTDPGTTVPTASDTSTTSPAP